ncbi:MAG: CO dehydrogenase/CO-methylating acetyl-CoA synthase complex subunit beta, partial [Oscillospiraceae bacterium]|nr:CO dehydrogenase/CO-methylating acetyl-CoA synthase complex subunit beta [Oscillospiraceae bacterium]
MTLFDRVFGGNDYNYERTVAAIDAAIAQYGESEAVAFPNTAYNLPCYYSITGKKINNLGELKAAMEADIKPMMTRNPRLQDAFDSGVASALCAEFLEVLKYIGGAEPYAEPEMGFLSDAFVRNLGLPLVTQDIPGVAVIIGGAENAAETVELAKSYQAQGLLVTLTGDAIKHCYEAGMNLGEGVRVVPLGYEMQSVIHVVSVALRAALIFGAITPGDTKALYAYTMDRIRAFVNAYKPLSDEIVSYGAGAICLGFPVVSNETENMFRVPKSLIQQLDTAKWNATSLEARDIKLKITKIDIPVSYATAFEGEIIRKGDMQVEVDGFRVDCFELVQTKSMQEVEDHKIEVIGPEIDEIEVGSK